MSVLQGPGAGRVRIVISPSSLVGRLETGGVVGIPFDDFIALIGDAVSAVTSVAGRTGAVVLAVADVSGAEALAMKNAVDGYAGLDGTGKIPLSLLPASIQGGVVYRGTWDAATNTPDLGASSPAKGDYYLVSVPGGTALGGYADWKAKDWAVYDGTVWEKVDNTDAVVSVNGQTGAISGLEVLAAKGVAGGYASLDSVPAVIQAVQKLRQWVPSANGDFGLNGSNLQWVDGVGLKQAERTDKKDQNGGYAGLDVTNGWVVRPVKNVAQITPDPAGNNGDVWINGGAFKYKDSGGTIRTLQDTGMKSAAGGYASLDNSSPPAVVEPVQKLRQWVPSANGDFGLNGSDLQWRDGVGVKQAERTDKKDFNGGYAGLDGTGKVNAPVKFVQGTAPGTASGGIGLSGGNLQYGDGANVRTVQGQQDKNVGNGYAGLDGTGALTAPVLSGVDPVAASSGSLRVNAGELKFADGANVRTAERVDRKNANGGYAGLDGIGVMTAPVQMLRLGAVTGGDPQGRIQLDNGNDDLAWKGAANVRVAERVDRKGSALGYAGLDGGGKVPAGQLNGLLVLTPPGLLAQNSNPPSVQYDKDTTTVIKSWDAGTSCHMVLTAIHLPARGDVGLKTVARVYMDNGTSVTLENATDADVDVDLQGYMNLVTGGDPTVDGTVINNSPRYPKKVAFEVVNVTPSVGGTDITADVGEFRIRGFCIPVGNGGLTILP